MLALIRHKQVQRDYLQIYVYFMGLNRLNILCYKFMMTPDMGTAV